MNPFTLVALAAAVAFMSQRSHAEDLPVKYNHVEYKQNGNTFTWKPLTGATPGGDGITFKGPTGIDTVQPKINTLARLPYDKRGTVPPSQMAKVSSAFTKANAGKAMLLAGKLVWPIGVIMNAGEIVDYFKGLGLKDIKNTGSGIEASIGRDDVIPSDGLDCSVQIGNGLWSEYFPTCFAAASSMLHYYHPTAFVNNCVLENCAINTKNQWDSSRVIWPVDTRSKSGSCPAGYYYVGDTCTPDEPKQTLDEQAILDKIAQESGWPTAAARATASALNTPGVTIQTEPPVVTGPSSIPGSKTTTTKQTQVAPVTTTVVAPGTPGAQPGTQTTTSTTTTNNTYNNNTVTTNTTTNTTVNITNNITNQTTKDTPDEIKEEEKKEDDKEDETPTDTPLGDIPELYERKYPDGIAGIWNAKSDEIKQTPLFTLASDLMPTGLTAGSCPSWHVDLSFSGAWGDYGMQDVSPPCWIWDIARLIVIASALILARALVFGG